MLRALCIALLAGPLLAQTGEVLGITGSWSMAGKEVHFGSSIPAGAVLEGKAGATIVILYSHAGKTWRVLRKCDEECRDFRPASAPPQAVPLTLAERIKQALAPYLHKNPEGLVAAVSRAFPELRESVVPLNGGMVDVSAAFRDAMPGEYQVTLEPLTGAAAAPVKLKWTSGVPAQMQVPGKPGLLRVAIVEASGKRGSDAWVLAVPPQQFAAANAEFQQVLQQVSEWTDLDPAATRPLLRAYLQSMAGRSR